MAAKFESSLFTELLHLLGTTRLRTAAYHPQTNGLVERFHRHLKVALTAHETPSEWVQRIPLTLLAIRCALKTDLSCSSAELVYGSTLRLPGHFFDPPAQSLPTSDYVQRLRMLFRQLQPQPTRPSPPRDVYITSDLRNATHVYVRNDAVRRPLQPHYAGPFPVLQRHSSTYLVDMNGRPDTIALERLKPAYMANAALDPPQEPLHTGAPQASHVHSAARHVRWRVPSVKTTTDN